MAYNIILDATAIKDLSGIDRKEAGRILLKIAENLSKNPAQYPYLKGESREFRKFRIGSYRVFFKIDDDNVIIYKIKHRKESYR